VFPYGSVPLKTYLPDGDIDLTVLSTPNLDEILPREVLRVLQEAEQNGNTEFEIKDTQFIDAEVKLVKCLVQDIVIDISFNQLGGLCTLCFLEQVDRLAGKDHLFKRSIILIKAWCYYESRILGAHHGLISTYALETLVLYIFHVFHASLNGPVEVLYRFLDYYAKFDWDNYCISLDGPVCKSSLPSLAVETPDHQGNDVLLGAEFRKNCMDMFIVPSKGVETDIRTFNLKNLNIIDPLKENNNLGRSVHRGNYYRIRSAFRYGARRLGKILQLSTSNIGDEIKKFFVNTLQRHKPKCRPDTPLIVGSRGFGTLSISSLSEAYNEDDVYSRFSNGDFDDYMNDVSTVSSTEANILSNDHNPPPYTDSNLEDEKTGLELWMERGGGSELVDGDTICLCMNNKETNDSSSDNLSFDVVREKDATDSIGEAEILNPFSDLTGDYDAHIRNLLYGQGCHGYALSATMVHISPPTSPYGNTNVWDPAAHSWSSQQNSGSRVNGNANGVVMGHPTYLNGTNRTPANVTLRGTGPYIPVVSCTACKEKLPPTRGRGRGRGQQPVSTSHHLQPGSNGHHLQPGSNGHHLQPVSNGHHRRPVSNGHHLQPVSNGHHRQPVSNGHLLQPLSNGHHLQPVSNGHHLQPVSNGHLLQPLSNGHHLQPVSNGHHLQPVSNGHHLQPVSNGHHLQPVSNGHHLQRARGGSGEPKLAVEADNRVTQTRHQRSPRQDHGNGNANLSKQTHQQQPSQVNSTTNGLANSRKLEFGSFKSLPEDPPNLEASPPIVQSPKVRKQRRNRENAFHLKNEEEFPPLSA
nr:polymerase, nucleotidyl transferase domain-containing protein [Tanacetum cinerariifolium]